MDRVTTLAADDFDGFYRAYFGDTVVATYGYTADLAEAQDITQEAFCRAWLRWSAISAYEDPAAWVRRIAHNLAMSRWRRIRVATAHMIKQRPADVPPVDEDHVAIVAALRKLPAPQREAIVLHHMMDVPLADVAVQLGAPVGTVKSWLHRSRGVLARELAAEIRSNVTVPPAGEVMKRASRRRTRVVVTAAAVVALIMLGVAVWQILRPHQALPPVLPSPSPTAAPTPGLIRQVDWANATIDFDVPTPQSTCPSGKVTFVTDGLRLSSPAWPRFYLVHDRIAYGDVDGDGLEEAVLRSDCQLVLHDPTVIPPSSQNPPTGGLLVVQRRLDGSLRTLGWLSDFAVRPLERWIADGVVYADVRAAGREPSFIEIVGWRWTGQAFEAVDASKRYPPLVPKDGATFDFSAISGQLQPCEGETVPQKMTFRLDFGAASAGPDWPWLIGPPDSSMFGSVVRGGPRWLQLGREGQPYLVAVLNCWRQGPRAMGSLVIFDLVGGRWQPLAAAPIAEAGLNLIAHWNTPDYQGARMMSADDRLILVAVGQDQGVTLWPNFLWDGTRLTRQACAGQYMCTDG